MSDSLWPHGLQHSRTPCPSPSPGVCSNSCPSSQWCVQPSHPLSSPSPPAFTLCQHQGLFKWVSSSHQVATVLEFQLQYQSSNEYSELDWFPLRLTGLIFLQSKGLLAVQGTPLLSCPINMESGMKLCSLYQQVQLCSPGTSLCGIAVQDRESLCYGLELMLMTLTDNHVCW